MPNTTTMTWEHLKRARDAYQRAMAAATAPFVMYDNPGFKIVVVPSVLPRRLTWAQRLLSWPWRPWETHVMEPNPVLPDAGTFYRLVDTLYCRHEDFLVLKDAARRFP